MTVRNIMWTRRLSLTGRILAVNVFAVALMASSFFYLDSFRWRIIDERLDQAREETVLLANALAVLPPDEQPRLLDMAGAAGETRLRVYGADGTLEIDSFALGRPGYELVDPEEEALKRHVARFLDKSIDWIVRAPRLPYFSEPERDVRQSWPSARTALEQNISTANISYAPDRTPMITAAASIPGTSKTLLFTQNARDITRTVRAERATLSLVILVVVILSVLLSLFLARTIARPLRKLANAAIRVRLGRDRQVVVPRLPERRDEIGKLARALSDMTETLRNKIDATEAFAADVSHELKNPLASLRSAIEGMETVKDDKLRKQLLDIAASDVQRLDRLLSDIAEASRLDAHMTRTRLETIDLGQMIEDVLSARSERNANHGRKIAFARPRRGLAVIEGDGTQIERVFSNLLDNAVSFCPVDGLVEIVATRIGDEVVIKVIDQGPGVPDHQRDEIFRRFHSIRPAGEEFGKHSGLGLAIARTIVEAHHGRLSVCDRDDGQHGACFRIVLPAFTQGEAKDF